VAQQLKPVGDRVVVKPKEPEQTTKAGIVLPATASDRPQQGQVVAVGSGRLLDNGTRVDLEVKQGDTVLFAKYSGTDIKLDDVELLVLNERDILAIVVNGK
jgi:chaperonin GroES